MGLKAVYCKTSKGSIHLFKLIPYECSFETLAVAVVYKELSFIF